MQVLPAGRHGSRSLADKEQAGLTSMESQGGPHGQLRRPLASQRTPHTDTVAVGHDHP
jgi:hypothetical protein